MVVYITQTGGAHLPNQNCEVNMISCGSCGKQFAWGRMHMVKEHSCVTGQCQSRP